MEGWRVCVCMDVVCVYAWHTCMKWVWDAGCSRAQMQDQEGEEGVGTACGTGLGGWATR